MSFVGDCLCSTPVRKLTAAVPRHPGHSSDAVYKVSPLGLASARPTELLCDPTYCSSTGWHLGTSGTGLVMGSLPAAVSLSRFQSDSVRRRCTFILQRYVTTILADSAWPHLFPRDLSKGSKVGRCGGRGAGIEYCMVCCFAACAHSVCVLLSLIFV